MAAKITQVALFLSGNACEMLYDILSHRKQSTRSSLARITEKEGPLMNIKLIGCVTTSYILRESRKCVDSLDIPVEHCQS